MNPGSIWTHKLTGEKFIIIGPKKDDTDERKLGPKIIVRGKDYEERSFFAFELEEVNFLCL